MMGFIKRFGDKVEIIGYNYSKKDGTVEIMKKQAVLKGIFTAKEMEKVKNMPKIVYCDANKRLPFKDNSFDFIYSIASIYLYDKKVEFLEECNRVLKKNGIARISPSFGFHKDFFKRKKMPERYCVFWEIWDKGKEISPETYFRRFKGVSVTWKNKGKGDAPLYLQIEKQKKLDFKLRFITSIDYNFLWRKWAGVKSIYTTQLKLEKPRWKVDKR